MRAVRHSGPPLKPGHPTTKLSYGPNLPLAELRIASARLTSVNKNVQHLSLVMLTMLNMLISVSLCRGVRHGEGPHPAEPEFVRLNQILSG